MATRTLPTSPGGVQGLSPLDVYVDTEIPAAYVETNLSETLNAAMTTMEVVTNCNLVAGGMVQGLNVTVTLGTSSTLGATACGIYALVDLGSSERTVSGRTSVIEGKLKIGASTAVQGGLACLCLDFENDNTQPMTSQGGGYIMLRERSASAQQMNNLFLFMDISPSTTDHTKLFSTDSSPGNQTHALRFRDKNGVAYYIMVTTHEPA